ncbi:MAG: IS200/IS605 family transposase [Verrucomicrobiae bacterium]|nr:IS200/IS605 family transposase [Verrucomicrobiae bacterium]
MANTYTSLDYHIVFSTQSRQALIHTGMEERLWAFMAGIAKNNGISPKRIGGVEDHVHLLVAIPPTLTVSKAVQLIKGGSSAWVNDQGIVEASSRFRWQEGYGAFTVSPSKVAEVSAYIANQREHHRRRSFQEEYREFLDRHGIDYDERYLWG